MADHTDEHDGAGPEGGTLHEQDHNDAAIERSTAPQSEFTTRQAAIGALVTAVGIGVAYVLPGLLG